MFLLLVNLPVDVDASKDLILIQIITVRIVDFRGLQLLSCGCPNYMLIQIYLLCSSLIYEMFEIHPLHVSSRFQTLCFPEGLGLLLRYSVLIDDSVLYLTFAADSVYLVRIVLNSALYRFI